MDFSKIIKIVGIVSTTFNLTVSQQRELDSYARMHQNPWVSEMKREEEIETMIRQEALRISKI